MLGFVASGVKDVANHLGNGPAVHRQVQDILHPPNIAEKVAHVVSDFVCPKPHPAIDALRQGASWVANVCIRTGPPAAACAREYGTTIVVVLSGTVLTAAGIAWWRHTRHYTTIRVENENDMFDIRALKTTFEANSANVIARAAKHRPGKHLGLASQRRDLEEIVCKIFRQTRYRFRDVGGSRTRLGHYNDIRHICVPQIDASDILRDAKEKRPNTDMCREYGSQCPSKDQFPGALISYADFYMGPDELSGIVKSHTFILTHNFEGDEGKLAAWTHEGKSYYEASWTKDPSGKISMGTPDGTPYFHTANLWNNEGCVIGKHGAFSYVRLARIADTDVIYAFPAPGVYRTSDKLVLHSSATGETYDLSSGNRAVISEDKVVVLHRHSGSVLATYDREPFERAALKVGAIPRGENYLPTLMSYVTSRFAQTDCTIHTAQDLAEIATEIADRLAFRYTSIMPMRYDPINIGLLTRVKRSVRRFVLKKLGDRSSGRLFCRFLAGNPAARYVAPWSFKDVRIPTYVKTTKLKTVKLIDPRDTRPDDYFQDGGAVPDADTHHCERDSASISHREHDHIDRDQSDRAHSRASSMHSLSEYHSTVGDHVLPVSSGSSLHASTIDTVGPSTGPGSGAQQPAAQDEEVCDRRILTGSVLVWPSPAGTSAIPTPSICVDYSRRGWVSCYVPQINEELHFQTEGIDFTEATARRLADYIHHVNWDTSPGAFEREIYLELERCKRESHASQGRSERVPADAGNELVDDCGTPDGLRRMGKKVPAGETRAARGRSRRRPKLRRTDPEGRNDQEFHQARNNAQLHGSQEHKSTIRRVPKHHRTVHKCNRTPGSEEQVPGEGPEPPATRKQGQLAEGLQQVHGSGLQQIRHDNKRGHTENIRTRRPKKTIPEDGTRAVPPSSRPRPDHSGGELVRD
ncbi:hypothetical protein 1 [Wuhan insect virus 21]|uniref:hypothetical protein 1 n=1 Tax=Wuhan insect virus 21 TaxID=1923725 RepID=UPI00090B9721|nr:hypothetical protein 1 [Wuhan insect virus 21]APG76532.1 hypothetical protein 1 [Wuhan insect virus 21]